MTSPLCHCPLKADIRWTHYCISPYFCNTVSSDFRLFHKNLEESDDPDLTWRPPLPHWRTGNVPPPTIQRLLPPNTKIPIGIQTSTFPDCFLQSTKIHSLIQRTTNSDCCQQIQKRESSQSQTINQRIVKLHNCIRSLILAHFSCKFDLNLGCKSLLMEKWCNLKMLICLIKRDLSQWCLKIFHNQNDW